MKFFLQSIFLIGNIFFYVTNICTAQTMELWGTNFRGGDDNVGRIVKVNVGDAVNEVYGFPSVYPGIGESLLKPLAFNGHLYLLSSTSGKYNGGVLTKYNPITNTSESLLDFNTNTGFNPFGCNLLLYNNKFYGLTTKGGANNKGTIYEFDPVSNIFTKKLDMTTELGVPYASRFEVFNNKFYTCTGSSGANGFGTLIEYDPATNTCTKKLDLTNDGVIGRQCIGGLTLYGDKLYGSMQFINNTNGCIFEYDPISGIYTKKIILDQFSTLRNFTGRFVLNGSVLYASCNQGAGQFDQGAIVEYNPTSNVLTTKIQFNFATGAGSFGDLILYNGKYYGTNTVGGANSSGGFFEWDAVTNIVTQRKPAGGSLGSSPQSSFEVLNNKLYTSCTEGIASTAYKSTLIEWDVPANTLTRKFIFGSGNGEYMDTKLVYSNGKVYGTTPKGGEYFNGILFSIDVNTGVYSQLHQFASVDFNGSGVSPLSIYNNKLYGITSQGGASSAGQGYIFEWDIATATFTKKINLTNTTGNKVIGQMYLHTDNKFYGITKFGGTNNTGTIFKYDPSNNDYTVLTVGPQSATGGFKASGNLLYVPALSGGNGYGTVYSFNIATSTGASVASYNASIGSATGEFTLLNGILYTGNADGSNSNGNILAFNTTTNNFTVAKTLSPGFPIGATNFGNGSNGMLAAYNNELYGFSVGGGLYGTGTTFKYNPSTNVLTKLDDVYQEIGGAITSGNGFITVQTNTTLPVRFSNFNVTKNNALSTLLKWQTAQEINSKYFEIEHSTNAVSFKKIGTVTAMGNSSFNNMYSFIHNNVSNGFNYYRLKQIDLDGQFIYSTVKQINFEQIIQGITKYYPNPTNGVLTIELANKDLTIMPVVKIIDNLGIVIDIISIAVNADGKIKLDLSKYPKGVYFVQIKTGATFFTEKILVE